MVKEYIIVYMYQIFFIQSVSAKETINKMKRQLTEWENIFANGTFDKGLISKINKELFKSTANNKKTIQLKMGKGPE